MGIAPPLGAQQGISFSRIDFDHTKYPSENEFQEAFKEWYANTGQSNFCCFLNFHGQNLLVGRKTSDTYGGFIVIGYTTYANQVIEISNGTWSFWPI